MKQAELLREWLSKVTLWPLTRVNVEYDHVAYQGSGPGIRVDIIVQTFNAKERFKAVDWAKGHLGTLCFRTTPESGELAMQTEIVRQWRPLPYELEDAPSFYRGLYENWCDLMQHEAKEWFRVDGKCFEEPHPERD